jgi:hypothetical protein
MVLVIGIRVNQFVELGACGKSQDKKERNDQSRRRGSEQGAATPPESDQANVRIEI